MRRRLAGALVVAVSAAIAAPAHGAVPAGNLLANPGAEDGQAAADAATAVPIPAWTTAGGFTVLAYGPAYPAPPVDGGANFFAAGTAERSSAYQTVDLTEASREIDAGRVRGVVRVQARESVSTSTGVRVAFFDSAGKRLTFELTSADETDGFSAGRVPFEVPRRARSARVTLSVFTLADGPPDAYFDNISLTLVRRSTPRPERGRTVLVTPTKGTVTVLDRRGHGKRVSEPTLLPIGSTLDTSRGTATVTSAANSQSTATQRGRFAGGVFAVEQPRGSDTVISLGGSGPRVCREGGPRKLRSVAPDGFIVLSGPSASGSNGGMADWMSIDRCVSAGMKVRRGAVDFGSVGSRRTSAARAARMFRHPRPRRLFGGRGRFRTRGRNSSATVRGRQAFG